MSDELTHKLVHMTIYLKHNKARLHEWWVSRQIGTHDNLFSGMRFFPQGGRIVSSPNFKNL